jgi:hypothetical protein
MYKVQILVNVVLHDNDKLFFSEIPLCAPPNPGSGFFSLECIFVQRCKSKSIVFWLIVTKTRLVLIEYENTYLSDENNIFNVVSFSSKIYKYCSCN